MGEQPGPLWSTLGETCDSLPRRQRQGEHLESLQASGEACAPLPRCQSQAEEEHYSPSWMIPPEHVKESESSAN